MNQFPKKLDPSSFELKWYQKWQENKIYQKQDTEKKPYSVLMPPPNVTGILHLGHVLNHTLQDLFIRRKRMQGFDAQWFPGMDHAGIATQSRVEKFIKENEGKTRYDYGREEFINKVMEWKEKYGGIIFNQLERLGVSANWDKLLFTMDEKASNAVRDVFIELFDQGLIYRGKRIINWSTVGTTALSDEEVDYKEVQDKFYTMKYKFVESDEFLSVSTVRPETIYGDVAVAVNPNDDRFKDKIGKKVIVPYVGREIPIIADDYADPEFGTGCVKITPAHDPNDFEVGQRNDLEQINTINPDGTMNELAGELNGLDRFEARKVIVQKLEEHDLFVKIEDYTHNVGFSQRGGEQIEPYLSDQWFISMKPMAKIALDAVADDKIKFHPPHWMKTYEHWMNNIRDWCISRQLWWGHRIPVYYAEDGRFTAARDEDEARTKLDIDSSAKLTQDEDVLDTWFSSWLWPMTTMRWDSENELNSHEDLNRYLPSDLLVTGPDIIFFWVARMIMATKKFNGNIPFKDVYFTSMIRDGKGRKLSKSLANSPDPLIIMDKYGADATRFTMIYLAPLGQDVRVDVDTVKQDIPSIEIGRNFTNKIFNAGRFLWMKKEEAGEGNNLVSENELSIADKWILSRLNTTLIKASEALDNFKVTEYSKLLYDFVWRDFCSWYVEIVKIQFAKNDDPAYKIGISNLALHIFNDILKMLHPVMPFITEELWHLINNKDENESISTQDSPVGDNSKINSELESSFELVQSITEEIRSLKAGSSMVDANQKLPVQLKVSTEDQKQIIENSIDVIKSLSKSSELEVSLDFEKPENCISSVINKIETYIIIEGQIDTSGEIDRLEKDAKRLEGQIFGISKKLSNERFVNNAPENVVAMERKKLEDMNTNLEKIKENLESLK